jgi:hypothetical protein
MRFKSFLETNYLQFTFRNVEVIIEEIPIPYYENQLLEYADQELLNFITNHVKAFASNVKSLFNKNVNAPTDEPPSDEPPTGDEPVPSEEPKKPLVLNRPDIQHPPLRKYRVTLRYPRKKADIALGHYEPDVLYVYAADNKEAKKKAEQHVKGMLDPVENDEERPQPRQNFLKGIKTKDMDLKAKTVKTWNDLVELLTHVANKRG